MDRKDVLNSSEYWTSKTQIELYNQAQKFMEATGKDRAHLAEYLGVSKGYVSQILNGDYDHRMSKFFELALGVWCYTSDRIYSNRTIHKGGRTTVPLSSYLVK